MEKNEEYSGQVLSLGTEGEGIIKCGQVTAFVPFCLEGEEVSFKTLKVSGGVAYGKLTEVHTVSEERVTPVCPYFEKCGGCQLQHASEEVQLKFKRQLIVNAFKKIAGIDAEVSPTVASLEQYGYRNKLAIPVSVNENGETVTGFFAPRSHRVVPIKECALQRNWSGKLLSALSEFMRECGYKGYDEVSRKGDIRHLVAREIEGKLIITVVATKVISLDGFAEKLNKLFKKYSLWLNVNKSSSNVIFGKEWHICRGEGFFMGEDCGIKYKAGANTFVQVNDGVRNLLYEAVIDEVKDKNAVAIDLYSGGGLLTAMLARACKAAYGIEIVEEAVRCADELKTLNGLENKMFNTCGKVEDELGGVLQKTEGSRRTIVCDPPRKGMDRKVVEAVLKSGAEKVVLVSCNPATLARDTGLLCGSLRVFDGQIVRNPDYDNGGADGFYRIDSVTPFDMFPQTKHVETLVVLSRKNPTDISKSM